MPTRPKKPEIVLRKGKPAAVIIDIDQYRELLERLEDAEDLRELEDFLWRKPLGHYDPQVRDSRGEGQ